jgi:DNA-binding CsgD family transcriptional regulator
MASSHPGWNPALKRGSPPVLRLSDLVSLRRFWGTEPYLIFHGPEEGRYPANAVLHMSRSGLTFLSLQRRTRDFSDTEMADLSLVQQVLASAFDFRMALDRMATKLSGGLTAAVDPVARNHGHPTVGLLDDALTKREAEVLALAAAGWTNHRIAGRLGISERTVRKHLGNTYEKTKSSGRVEAAVWWQRHT